MYKEWGNNVPLSPFLTLQWDRYRHGKQRAVIISSNISTPLRPAFHGHAASLDSLWCFFHSGSLGIICRLPWNWIFFREIEGWLDFWHHPKQEAIYQWLTGKLMSGFCTGFRFETTTHEVAQAGLKLMLLLPWEELRSQMHTTMSGCGFYFLPSVCVYELDLICQEHLVTSPFIYFLINHIFMPVSTFGYLFYSWG